MRPVTRTRHLPCLLIAASFGALLAGGAVHAQEKARPKSRMEVRPFLGVDQTVVTDLSGGNGETLTYTSVIVGVDANIHNRSTEVRANLAYQHQFTWSDRDPDSNVISGVVSARTNVAGRALQLEGGVMASRIRTDGFTGANGNLASAGSKSQIYSAYAGPTLTTRVGDLDVNAAYRLGYNRLEDGFDNALSSTPFLDSFDESWTHVATASVGVQPDVILPIGIAVGVGYQREDASQLSQRFEDKWGRLDVTVPLTDDLAAIGGVGYQSIQISNKDAVRDTATGLPIRDNNGRFSTDPASPRILSYDNEEMIWDVGILWRPSRRTSLQLTVGHRYGSESVRGSLSYQPNQRTSLTISLFDSVDSFGRALSGNLANLPDNFIVTRNPFSGDINGFNDTLSGIRTANYRNRGVAASYSYQSGPWRYGLGLGYSRRKFLGNDPVFVNVNGLSDENYFAAGAVSYALDDRSSIDFNAYANQFNSGIAGLADVFNAGAYLSYHRRVTHRLRGIASVGVDHVKAQGVDSVLTGLAQLGMRYSF